MFINTAITVFDPTKTLTNMGTSISTTSTTPYTPSANDYATQVIDIYSEEIASLREQIVEMKIELLCIRGKVTETEADNLIAMLKSKDQAAIELAKTLIENA